MKTGVKLFTTSLLFLVLFSFGFAQEPDTVTFTYGVVGMKSGQPDDLFEVENGGTLHSGDYFKINYKLHGPSYFYIVLEASDGSFYLYHTASHGEGAETVTGSATSLDWLQLDNSTGTEKIYMICSTERLEELEEQFEKYEGASGKTRDKYARKIDTELTMVTYVDEGEAPLVRTRLDRPEMVGASYRSADESSEGQTAANQLFGQAGGERVAWDIIEIVHE